MKIEMDNIKLTNHDRDIILWRLRDKKSYKEISESWGYNRGGINRQRSLLLKALIHLIQELVKNGFLNL